jgi:hypothetical protein
MIYVERLILGFIQMNIVHHAFGRNHGSCLNIFEGVFRLPIIVEKKLAVKE